MALIDCPECGAKVSEKATACPRCGHPVQEHQTLTLQEALSGKRWQARSDGLCGHGLVCDFMQGGQFHGQLTGNTSSSPEQDIKGTWRVVNSQLFLNYESATFDIGRERRLLRFSSAYNIIMTEGSEASLLGVDTYGRNWEWRVLATS